MPILSHVRARTLCGALLVTGLVIGPAASLRAQTTPAAPPLTRVTGTAVMGTSVLTADQMAAFVVSDHTPRIPLDIRDLAQLFIEEGAVEGVRADLAWAQSILESGYFSFPDNGQVRPQDNNYAGIGAYDSASRGFWYPTARMGVRAQMQLLHMYASASAPTGSDRLVRAPVSKRGSTPVWELMGNGNWATSTTYAEKVLNIYRQMLAFAGQGAHADDRVSMMLALPRSAVTTATKPAPPPKPVLVDSGAWLVDVDGQVYARGNTRFWGSTASRSIDAPVIGIARTPSNDGYWIVTQKGTLYAFGYVAVPSTSGGNGPAVVAIASTPSGDGLWLLHIDGTVETRGDAPPLGPYPLHGVSVTAFATTPTGTGAWIVGADGVVVAVGDAPDLGSWKGTRRGAVVGIAATPSGRGFWLLAADGAVDPHGDALNLGRAPAGPAVGIAATPTGRGYWIALADGGVNEFGDALPFASTGTLRAPAVGIAGRSAYSSR